MAIEFSDNPAGRMATRWLRVMNIGDLSDTDARELILPGAVPLFDLHTDPGRHGLSAFHEPGTPFCLASIEQEEPFRVQASVEDPGGSAREVDRQRSTRQLSPHSPPHTWAS